MGFTAGQIITIDSGANRETAVIASTGRGAPGGPGGARGGPGITLTSALTRAQESGAQIAGHVPTPGAPNQYTRR